jgi:hypothetical protein
VEDAEGGIVFRKRRLERIFAGFRSTDHDVQRESHDALAELTEAGSLSSSEAAQALRLAAEPLPQRENDWEDSAVDLVLAAVTGASDDLVPVVAEVYAHLPTPFARTAALRIPANVGSREAVATLARLLSAPPHPREDLASIWWEAEPRHAELVVPALVKHLDNEASRADVFDIALRLARTEPIAPEHAALLVPVALADLRSVRPRAPTTFDWSAHNVDSALERRHRAERALVLIGRAPATEETIEELSLWTGLDSVPAGAAVASLVRLGVEPNSASVARIARDPEARASLFDALSELKRLDLIPPECRTQEALAEAQLVEWLTYPAELGRPPDETRFVETISAETDSGPADLYVFRVRAEGGQYTGPTWFAGVAGPYLRANSPTTAGGWMTFSAFEPWDERSPLDHAELVAEILESWRKAEK